MPKKTADNIVPIPPPAPAWPEAKETRHLPCKLAPAELAEKSDEMARHQLEANDIEARKKSTASHYKAQLDEKAAQLSEIALIIRDRAELRNVKCEWRYEQAGFDSDRKPIFHPEKKTLVRLDTGESVEVSEITDHERQLKLNLDQEQEQAGAAEETPQE